MGTRSEIGTGLGTGRDTRTKRRKLPRNCLATDPEGREMNPCCVSQPETRQEMLPQWGGGDSGGQTNPFPYSQGTCQAVGMSLWRGCHPARALSLQKSPLLYLLSPQAWLAFFIYIYFFFSCWILLSKSRAQPFHVSAPKLPNLLPWPGFGIVVLGALQPGADFPGAPGLCGLRGEVGGDGHPLEPLGSPPVLWEPWPPSHCPHPGPGMLLILSSREEGGQSKSLCRELSGEDGKTGQKWGFWKVCPSFSISSPDFPHCSPSFPPL